MVNRFVEVMALALLVVLTIGTTFQVLNYQLLRELQDDLRKQPRTVTVNAPPAQRIDPPAPPQVVAPQPARAAPPQPEPQPERQPAPDPQPAAEVPDSESPGATPAKARQDPEPEARAETPESPRKPEGQPPSAAWEQHGGAIRQVITQLYDEQYDKVIERFTPDLAENLERDVVVRVMEETRKRDGELVTFREGERISGPPSSEFLTFRVPVVTDKDRVIVFSVAITPDGKIAGLHPKPASE